MSDDLFRRLGCVPAAALLLAILLSGPRAWSAGAAPPTAAPDVWTIRVGICVYDDSGILKDAERQRYERLFAELQGRAEQRFGQRIEIRYRAATYSEVVHWCRTNMVDIAVLSPGTYNELMQESPGQWQYLCTMGQPVDSQSSAQQAEQAAAQYRFEYGLKCMVKRGSALHQSCQQLPAAAAGGGDPCLAALNDAFNRGKAALYFVDPLSVSGGIAPLYLLRTNGQGALQKLSPGQVEYTESHSRSLKILAEQIPDNSSNFDSTKERVAFVWDGAALNEGQEQLAELPLRMLKSLRIPENAVVVSTQLYQGADERTRAMLDALHLNRNDFQRLDRYEEKYGSIRRWREHITRLQDNFEEVEDRYAYEPTPGFHRADWTAFFQELDSYVEQNSQMPRIAVVFGGGGAKCAYQAGAIEVLERKLREDRVKRAEIRRKMAPADDDALPTGGYDISLVVGTSGGALNALPVALGISKTDKGMKSIQATWQQLDGRDIISPELAIRVSVGGWLFILHLVLVLVVVRVNIFNRRVVSQEMRFRAVYCALLTLGGIQLLSCVLNLKWPWFWLSWIDYNWYPIWIFLGSGVSVCGLLLTLTGVGMWVYDRLLARDTEHVIVSTRFVREAVVWITLAFLLVEIPLALFFSAHVSDDSQFERQVQRLFTKVLQPQLADHGRSLGKRPQLPELSAAIFEDEVLQRDLIISATTLEGVDNAGVQKDVYFYAHAAAKWDNVVQAGEDPPAPQFHDLRNRSPHKLFDALIGSGTVFPIFPPRHFGPLWEGGHEITLVDGGFSHNNPVEAAVKWGATHIILVKPSQDLKDEAGATLVANAGRAFSHLFEQAQAVDARAMSEAWLFVLRPESESHQIPLLCFASDPIREMIDLAKRETESNSPFLAKFR